MSKLEEVPPPARNAQQYIRVLWAKVGEPVKAISLSSRIRGCYLHWVDGRSVLHREPAETCPWCAESKPLKWYAWLFGYCRLIGAQCLIQIPVETFKLCPIMVDTFCNLRGADIILVRPSASNKSVVQATVRLGAHRVDTDRPEPDTLSIVETIYNRFEEKLWKERQVQS